MPSDLDVLLTRVDALRADLDAMRPLDKDQVGKAMQRLRLEWTYHSNAIEGNSLTYGETRALLMHGVTAQGKPLKDHLDIERHGEVITYIEEFVRSDEPVRVDLIKEIHLRLMGEEYEVVAETPNGGRVRRTVRGGVYKEHPNNVETETGEIYYYALPVEVPGRMAELVEWLGSDEAAELHPVAQAAVFHHRFVEIHPFPDGNGRTSRALMNLLLMRAGLVPAVIRQERRPAYYGALAEADGGDEQPITAFVAEELAETLELYLRALKGEPDPSAFGKRVALLKRQAEFVPSPIWRERAELLELAQSFVLPLLNGLEATVVELRPLFRSASSTVGSSNGKTVYNGENIINYVNRGMWDKFHFESKFESSRLNTDMDVEFKINGVIRDNEKYLDLKATVNGVEVGSWVYRRVPSTDEAGRVIDTVREAMLQVIEGQQAIDG